MKFTGRTWRPHYEADSCIIELTSGCTYHKCNFCNLYQNEPFCLTPLSEFEKGLEEIKSYQPNARRIFLTGANPFALSYEKLKPYVLTVRDYLIKCQTIAMFASIRDIKNKEVTFYFIDMINICLNYELLPPDFLFGMAKAFICLNGISLFSENRCTAKQLLQEQAIEFMIKRSIKDCKSIVMDTFYTAPKTLKNTVQFGFANTIAKAATDSNFKKDIERSVDHLKEMLDLIKSAYC